MGEKKDRSRAEVLREYQEFYVGPLRYNPSQRERIEERDAPERRYRWRVELDCGCTTEALTYGQEQPPTNGPYVTFLGGDRDGPHPGDARHMTFVIDAGSSMKGQPPGYLWCSVPEQPYPWRKITGGWANRREHRSDQGERYASWDVRLSCGHKGSVITETDWRPEDGYRPNPETAEKIRQQLQRMAGKGRYDDTRRYLEHRLEGEWPEPHGGRVRGVCQHPPDRLLRANRAAYLAGGP